MGKTDIADARIASVRAPCLSNSRETAEPVAFGRGKSRCTGQAPQRVHQQDEIVTYHGLLDKLVIDDLLGTAIRIF